MMTNGMKWALTATLLGSAACSSAPKPAPVAPVAAKPKVKTPAEHLADAQTALDAKQYDAAIKGYDAVLAKDPENTGVLYNRAYALQQAGRNGEAIDAYGKVLEIDPKSTDAAVNLGALLKAEGKTARAIEVTQKALEGDEFNGRLLNNLSVLLRNEKRYDEAVAAVRKLLMRDKENVDAYKNLSLIYYEQEKYALSQTILENALEMAKAQDRKDADIYVNLGMIYLAREENGKAMAAFKKAKEIQPDHPVANYNIASLALGHRDYGLAAESYATVSQAWKDNYDVVVGHGYALQGQGKLTEAATELERARTLLTKLPTKRPEEDVQILYQLMVIYQGAEQPTKALEYGEMYMKAKGLTCGPDDYDGFCGRYNGIKLMIEMAAEAAAPPEEEKREAMDASESSIFTEGDEPVPGEEGAEGEEAAEGEAATDDTAEGGEAPAEDAEAGEADPASTPES